MGEGEGKGGFQSLVSRNISAAASSVLFSHYSLFLLILLEFVVSNCQSFARPIAAKLSFAT